MTSLDDLGGFKPYNDAHAIVTASITIGFARADNSSVDSWPAIRKAALAARAAMKLPIPQPYYGLSLTFDAVRVNVSLGAPAPHLTDSAGLSFIRIDEDDQLIERFFAAKDNIHIASHSYIRWEPFLARATTFLESVWPAYSHSMNLVSINLEYVDRFDAQDNMATDITKLIRKDSPLIALEAISTQDAWHCHSARVEGLANGVRRLHTSNLNVGDFADRTGVAKRAVIIQMQLQDAVVEITAEPELRNSFGLPEVLATLRCQHDILKAGLGRVITPHACERIGLEG